MTKLFSAFQNDLAVDLDDDAIRVFARGKGLVADEPAVVAVREGTRGALAVGAEAVAMAGRGPGDIAAVRPVSRGTVREPGPAAELLKAFFARASAGKIRKPRVLLPVPGDIDNGARTLLKQAAAGAGARTVLLIERPMAAAIGAGLPVTEPEASLVVDVAAGTAEIAVISLAGVVLSRTLHPGGLREAPEEAVAEIVQAVEACLADAPPELSADLVDRGIALTGSGARLAGLESVLAGKTGLPVRVADDPATAAVRGAGSVLDMLDRLSGPR